MSIRKPTTVMAVQSNQSIEVLQLLYNGKLTVVLRCAAAFALFGLKTLNLPMYTAIKRLTPMMILVIKVRSSKVYG